jgi:transposase-like protein
MKRAKRTYTPEQKVTILSQIESDIKSGSLVGKALEKADIAPSLYFKWKRQLEVGIQSSLRNNRPPVDLEKRQLTLEVKKLRAIVLSQSQSIAELKKEMNLAW